MAKMGQQRRSVVLEPIGEKQRNTVRRHHLGHLMNHPLRHSQRVRLPISTTTRSLLVGSISVHTQDGAHSRRKMALSSLIAPALMSLNTAYNSSSWSGPR